MPSAMGTSGITPPGRPYQRQQSSATLGNHRAPPPTIHHLPTPMPIALIPIKTSIAQVYSVLRSFPPWGCRAGQLRSPPVPLRAINFLTPHPTITISTRVGTSARCHVSLLRCLCLPSPPPPCPGSLHLHAYTNTTTLSCHPARLINCAAAAAAPPPLSSPGPNPLAIGRYQRERGHQFISTCILVDIRQTPSFLSFAPSPVLAKR